MITIKVDAITPPTIFDTSFKNVSRDIVFIVPEESRNAYAEHEYWGEFIREVPTDVENSMCENIKIFTQNGTLYISDITTDYQIYNISGRLIYSGNESTITLPSGIYLIAINDKIEKIAL